MISEAHFGNRSVTSPVTSASHLGQLLFAVLAEIEVLGRRSPEWVDHSTDPDIVALRDIGVPYQPDLWFGTLSLARRKAFSRATRKLVKLGYLRRVTQRSRDRVTHVRPTQTAIDWILRTAVKSVNRTDLLNGLGHCVWAFDLYQHVLDEQQDSLRDPATVLPDNNASQDQFPALWLLPDDEREV